jgi:hypothetical protein
MTTPTNQYTQATYSESTGFFYDRVDCVYAYRYNLVERLTVDRDTQRGATSMTVTEKLMSNAQLTQAVTDACVKALKAGMSPEDVVAVLVRVQELIEAGDDE